MVRPSEPAEEIAAKLASLTDPDNGTRVVRNVYRAERIYAGSPLAGEAPDLVVGFESGYRVSWQTALGGAPSPVVEDNRSRWSGDHIFDPSFVPAIILSNAKLQGDSYRGIDLAPTILAGLGLEKPGHMTGKDLLQPETAPLKHA